MEVYVDRDGQYRKQGAELGLGVWEEEGRRAPRLEATGSAGGCGEGRNACCSSHEQAAAPRGAREGNATPELLLTPLEHRARMDDGGQLVHIITHILDLYHN